MRNEEFVLVFEEEALYVDCGAATCAGGGNGLAVDGVGHVAGCEHAGNIGSCRCSGSLDIALGVKLDEGCEYVGVGLVAYGEEEAVDLYVECVFFGCAFAANEFCALKYVGTGESQCLGVVQHFDVGAVGNALLHVFGGS